MACIVPGSVGRRQNGDICSVFRLLSKLLKTNCFLSWFSGYSGGGGRQESRDFLEMTRCLESMFLPHMGYENHFVERSIISGSNVLYGINS